MALHPMLFDSVALNVLSLFFSSKRTVLKNKEELEEFITSISPTTDSEILISKLVERRYLLEFKSTEQVFRLSQEGMKLLSLLQNLSEISIMSTSSSH